jgi:hypothetical protein
MLDTPALFENDVSSPLVLDTTIGRRHLSPAAFLTSDFATSLFGAQIRMVNKTLTRAILVP